MEKRTIGEFIVDSENELLKRKKQYTSIMDDIIHELKTICSKYDDISIIGRVKDSSGIREKIFRKNYYSKYQGDVDRFINDLPDGIGIRIICCLNSDEAKIVNTIEESLKDGNFQFYINTDGQPQTQKNGLDIYRMDGVYNIEEKQIRFELQVKSQTHNLWGEVEHSLFYKNYDYIIGGNVFSGFMKNIYKELEIIDDEMMALKKHLKKDNEDKNSELREIATRIISERFEKDITDIIGCAIDLREVYALLSEISIKFNCTNDDAEIVQQIQDLTVKLKNANNIMPLDSKNLSFTLEEDCIGAKYLDIAKLIDQNLKAGDIFWVYFYVIYKKLTPNITDSKRLGDLAGELMEIYKGISDDVVLINENEEDFDLSSIINQVIFLAAEDVNKISFFSTSFCMKEIKKCVKEKLLVFEKLFAAHPSVLFEDNKDSLIVFLYISIMLCLKEKISISRMERFDFSKMRNDYQLVFSPGDFRSIEKELAEFKQLDELIDLFGEENEN